MTETLGNTTIYLIRALLVVDTLDNTSYRDWANATTTAYPFCMIQPFQLSSKLQKEDSLDREWTAAFFRVWMPSGTDIVGTDRLIVNGLNMDVYGQPGHWYDLEGNESHVTALCLSRKG